MRNLKIIVLSSIVIMGLIVLLKFTSSKQIAPATAVSFYEVPLVCEEVPEIGCGTQTRPLFSEATNYPEIKETWLNRSGTVIAIVWSGTNPNEELSEKLFHQENIDAKLISDKNKTNELLVSFSGKDKWYKGMDIDQLSIEEAGTIAFRTIDQYIKNCLCLL